MRASDRGSRFVVSGKWISAAKRYPASYPAVGQSVCGHTGLAISKSSSSSIGICIKPTCLSKDQKGRVALGSDFIKNCTCSLRGFNRCLGIAFRYDSQVIHGLSSTFYVSSLNVNHFWVAGISKSQKIMEIDHIKVMYNLLISIKPLSQFFQRKLIGKQQRSARCGIVGASQAVFRFFFFFFLRNWEIVFGSIGMFKRSIT